MAPIKAPQVQEALQLFRSILRLHRTRLPGEMRQLGDAHARSEFQAHLRSKNVTPEQWSEFMLQWKGYLAFLHPPAATSPSTANAAPAAEHAAEHATAVSHVSALTEGLDEYLSPEQKLRMEALRKEALQLGQAMLGKAMPSERVADQLGSSEQPPGAHQ